MARFFSLLFWFFFLIKPSTQNPYYQRGIERVWYFLIPQSLLIVFCAGLPFIYVFKSLMTLFARICSSMSFNANEIHINNLQILQSRKDFVFPSVIRSSIFLSSLSFNLLFVFLISRRFGCMKTLKIPCISGTFFFFLKYFLSRKQWVKMNGWALSFPDLKTKGMRDRNTNVSVSSFLNVTYFR